MEFNSVPFLIFAAVFFLFWPRAKTNLNVRWLYITAASFVFYGWWDWRYLILIVVSCLVDFSAALGMEKFPKWRRGFLVTSVFANLSLLATFKYAVFFIGNLASVFKYIGFTSFSVTTLDIPSFFLTNPVGISFFTFQSMSYTIDVYRRRMPPTRNIFHFFSYIAMFPQLVAGPIVRADAMLPQLKTELSTTEEQRWEGLRQIAFGFFKKLVLADNLARFVNSAFALQQISGGAALWWLVAVSFALQIYFDFSGYSDVAIGLARWMGLDIPVNFSYPYTASSLREFWNRWHISLSTWFRDYVFIPLGGSRSSSSRVYFNLFITFLLSGLWHGAGWTYIVWATIHAFFLCLERRTQWPERIKKYKLGRAFATAIVFSQVSIALIFFRAVDLTQAFEILSELFLVGGAMPKVAGPRGALLIVVFSTLVNFHYWWQPKFSLVIPDKTKEVFEVLLVVVACCACVFFRGPEQTFIYFQF